MSNRKFPKAQTPLQKSMAKFETYTLKSLKVQFAKKFGRAMVEKTTVSMVEPFLEDFAQTITVQIETLVFGQKMPTEYPVAMLVPATWWHHLVDDHFPEWYKRWRPVKRKEVYRTITIDHWALLPQFDKVPPGYEIQMFTEDYFDEPEIPTDKSKS